MEPRNEIAHSGKNIAPRVLVIIRVFANPVVYFAFGIDVLAEEPLHEHWACGLINVYAGCSVVSKRQELMNESPSIFARPTKFVSRVDSKSIEDFNVTSLTLLALNRLYLLPGGIAVVLEAGRVVGVLGGALFDYTLGELPRRLIRSDELTQDQQAVARINLRNEAHRAVPAEVPRAVDKFARVIDEGLAVEGGGELGEHTGSLAHVEVKLILTGEVVGVREDAALGGDPFLRALGEFRVGIVWVLRGVRASTQ